MAKTKTKRFPDKDRVTLRIDESILDYFKQRAQQCETNLSDYLRQRLVEGVIVGNVKDFDEAMQQKVEALRSVSKEASTCRIDEKLLGSIYLIEELLKAIVEARDIQELYAAQDRVRKRLQKEH